MKPLYFRVLPLLAITSLSACGNSYSTATRSHASPHIQLTGATGIAVLDEQAASLNRMADDMVRKSMGKGAMIGAAVGCGLALASASNAKNCVAGAAAGGVGGALIGRAHGKKQVQKRMAKVNPSDMVRAIRRGNKVMQGLHETLPGILAKQDAEVARLKAAQAAGDISQADFDRQIARIRDARMALAQALTDSAQKARQSADNLSTATRQGQPGLGWHIGAARQIERQAISARAKISLL